MKRNSMWSKAVPALLALSCLGQPAVFANETTRERSTTEDRIEGVWLAKVTITNCATGEALPFPGAKFDAMGMFASNGTLHNTDQNNPALRSETFGYWERTGRYTYRFAFRHFRFDLTGMLTGSQIVRHDVVLSRDGLSYASSGHVEFYDVSGIRMLPDGCAKATATRFE
jgi:hypothetical protein